MTYDATSTTTNVYIDGQLVAMCGGMPGNPGSIELAKDLFIGRSPYKNDPYLGGELGCFRIYNRTITYVPV